MALINCPECKKEISDNASACIYCGYPLAEELKKEKVTATKQRDTLPKKRNAVIEDKQKRLIAFIGIAILLAIIIISIIICSNKNGNSANEDGNTDYYNDFLTYSDVTVSDVPTAYKEIKDYIVENGIPTTDIILSQLGTQFIKFDVSNNEIDYIGIINNNISFISVIDGDSYFIIGIPEDKQGKAGFVYTTISNSAYGAGEIDQNNYNISFEGVICAITFEELQTKVIALLKNLLPNINNHLEAIGFIYDYIDLGF